MVFIQFYSLHAAHINPQRCQRASRITPPLPPPFRKTYIELCFLRAIQHFAAELLNPAAAILALRASFEKKKRKNPDEESITT